MTDLTLLGDPHPSTIPGGLEIEVQREVPGLGVIRFEQAPAGYLTKKGERRLQDWRAYWFTPTGGKRVRLPSVTTWLSAVLPKDLTRWGEMHGVIGACEAIRRGELDPLVHTDEDAVERVRALRLGADAARDRAADRGIDVHAALETYMRTGHLPPTSLEHAGYMRGLEDFLREYDPEPTAIEALVADPERGYAGRLDAKAIVRSKAFPSRAERVLDLKTAKWLRIFEGAHYQVQSYRLADMACGGEETDTPLIVAVDAEGRFGVMDCAVDEAGLDRALEFYRSKKPVSSVCSAFANEHRVAA